MSIRKIPIDDTARPVRATPRRHARSIEEWSAAILALASRGQSLEVFMESPKLSTLINDLVAIGQRAGALAALVLVGEEPLAAAYVDVAAGRGVQPVLDVIEDRGKSLTAENAESTEAKAEEEREALPKGMPIVPAKVNPSANETAVEPGSYRPVVAPLSELKLPRSIMRKLAKTRATSVLELIAHRKSGLLADVGLDEHELARVDAALDARAAAAPDVPAGVALDADGAVEQVVVPSADPTSGEEIVFDRNGTHKRDAETKEPRPANSLGGGRYTSEQLGLRAGALEEISAMSSSQSLVPGGKAKTSKLSGVYVHAGQAYAVTGGSHQWRIATSVRLVPIYPLDAWPGKTRSYYESGTGYHGVVAELRGRKWVLGRREDEVTIEATAEEIAAAAAEVESLKTLDPELAEAIGDWRAVPVEELELNRAQLSVLETLRITTAGDLDDVLEGRRVVRWASDRPVAMPIAGKPSSEWADVVKAPLRAALAKVRPAAELKTWNVYDLATDGDEPGTLKGWLGRVQAGDHTAAYKLARSLHPKVRAASLSVRALFPLPPRGADGQVPGWRAMLLIDRPELSEEHVRELWKVGIETCGELADALDLGPIVHIVSGNTEPEQCLIETLRNKPRPADAPKPKRGLADPADGHDPDKNQRVLGKEGPWLRCTKCQGDWDAPAPPGRGFECHKPRVFVLAARPCAAKNWDRAPVMELVNGRVRPTLVLALERAGFATVGDVCQAFTARADVEGFDDFDRDDILEAIIDFKARAVDVPDAEVAGPAKRRTTKPAART